MVGDYMNYDNPRLIIDRKQNLSELCNNVCQDHDRFRKELRFAQDNDIQLVILCLLYTSKLEIRNVPIRRYNQTENS